MWEYKKRLEYPVKIKNPNPALAKVIISQLGGINCICDKKARMTEQNQ